MQRGKSGTLAGQMIAIEIRVNGKLVATCGADDARNISAMVSARADKTLDAGSFVYTLECMGVRPKSATTDEVLKWVGTRIALGDDISLKVVEAADVQEPIDRQDISNRP